MNMGGIWVLFIYGSLFYLFSHFYNCICNLFTVAAKKTCGRRSRAAVAAASHQKSIFYDEKTLGMVENYASCAGYIKRNPSVLFKTMGISTCQILFQFSVPYFVYKAFGLSAYSYLDILALQTVLTICVSSLPLPGAVGASGGQLFKNVFVIFDKILFFLPCC